MSNTASPLDSSHGAAAGELPSLTIIIPVRNEEGYLATCLNSIVNGSYPLALLEVFVVDGNSEDLTRQIALDYSERYNCIFVLENPSSTVPHAMNIGIAASHGRLIVRMDAHARYGEDYLRRLIYWMELLGADNVGGIVLTRPASDGAEAKAVAAILAHPFGMGNSLFRVVQSGGPIEVDTVPFGCYRREIFDRIGLYDELFIRNQDDEFNARLRKSGGRIFLVPEIQIEYVARSSLSNLARMLYQYGYFKPLVAIKLGRPSTWRQLVPPAFVLSLITAPLLFALAHGARPFLGIVFLTYGVANVIASLGVARRQGWNIFRYMLWGFVLAHVAYGFGYLRGGVDFGLLRRHLKKDRRSISLSR